MERDHQLNYASEIVQCSTEETDVQHAQRFEDTYEKEQLQENHARNGPL